MSSSASSAASEVEDAAKAPKFSATSWPFSILTRRCSPKVRIFEGPRWHSRHHVVPSKNNERLPPGARGYFDGIPSIRRARGGEFDNLMMQQPVINDLQEHAERLERRFQTFPYFRPSSADVRAKSREKQAATPPPPRTPSPTSEFAIPCEALLAAAKSRVHRLARGFTRTDTKVTGMGHIEQSQTVMDFLKYVTTAHGNLVRLWRKLDKDGNMMLTKMEFLQGLKQLKHQRHLQKIDVNKLWSLLDRDDSGLISFFEFAPENAMDLARLKQWGLEGFGSMQDLFKAMDVDGSRSVSFPEFHSACINLGLPKRLHKSTGTLFNLLEDPDDDLSKGVLTESELQFLDSWNCPTYLRETANKTAALAFRNALLSQHGGNALTAWRKALDRDSSMKVSHDEFIIQCKQLARHGLAEADPDCGATPIYCAIDYNRSGYFTLKDWDPHIYRCLVAFQIGAKAKYGKLTNFIRAHEKGRGAGITRLEFRQATKTDFSLPSSEADVVFCGLAAQDGMKSLQPADVLFLQRWEPNIEMEDEKRWTKMVHAHRSSQLDGLDEAAMGRQRSSNCGPPGRANDESPM